MTDQEARDEREAARLIYEVRMMLSSVASHGPHALTTTDDPMYTANLLGRLSKALKAATDRKHPEPEITDDYSTILDMANGILETRAGQIGTHYETCWMNHVGCFAAYVRLALTKGGR